MPVTMKDLGIDTLSPEDRIALAMELWDSLGEDRPRSPMSPERRSELNTRCAEMDADPSVGLTKEEFWARVRGRQPKDDDQ